MLVGLVSTLLLLILLYDSDWHTFSSLLKQKSLKASPPRPTMAVSMRDVDPAFQGAGQKDGLEIWQIEKLQAVPVPRESHDEAGTAAIKTVELDAALGGRAVQYREVQGNETEKFLSYFKPCIIPEEGGVASGFRHAEVNAREHVTRLFVCRGKYTVHVKEVPFARSSLNHEDIFILDTESKIFQFNGSNSSIQERAKALEVVQYLKDTNHEGKCDVVAVAFLGEERKKMKTLIAPPVLLTVTAVALYLII